MKPGLGWTRDPSLHLVALFIALFSGALVLNACAWRSPKSERVVHPRSCHACSVCSPETIAARDAYLLRTGAIAAPEDGE
jgi:hypothetical protein